MAWQQTQKGLAAKSVDPTSGNHGQNNDINITSSGGDGSGQGGNTAATVDNHPAKKTPVIIYASRTHSQLSQVVRELKNTRYRPRQ